MTSLHVRNEASRDPVEVVFDGRHERDLSVGEEVGVRFRDGVARLAQLAGANFYHRMRERFGQLAGLTSAPDRSNRAPMS